MGRRFVRVRERQTAIDWATEIQELLEVQYPEAARLRLVCDQLNTQGIGSLYEAFPPEQARRLATRVWRSTILPSMAVGSRSPRSSSVLCVFPTSPRESRFSLAYSHPEARHPMTWRPSCRSRPPGTRHPNWTNEQGRVRPGARRGRPLVRDFPKRSGIRLERWPRSCRPRAWPNSDGGASQT